MSAFSEALIGTPATDEELIDPVFLSDKLGRDVKSAQYEDMGGAGGMSGAKLARIVAVCVDGSTCALVVKRTRPGQADSSKQLGLFREAHFFQILSSIFPEGFLPKVYHVFGDAETGEKLLLMEDLGDTIQTGYFFGPGSPLNWGKDLSALTATAPEATMSNIVREISIMAAKMHAKYWKKTELKEMTWLRGASWLSGKDEQAWAGSQEFVRVRWEKQKEKISSSTCETVWNPDLVAVMDASYAKISWDDFQKRIHNSCWTLTHVSIHLSNLLWHFTQSYELYTFT
jgi:hypothetical protein